jgi:hypothetical protein
MASCSACRLLAASLVDPVDQFALVVALPEIELEAVGRAGAFALVLHIGQGL